MALLAAYCVRRAEGQTLEEYLADTVFRLSLIHISGFAVLNKETPFRLDRMAKVQKQLICLI